MVEHLKTLDSALHLDCVIHDFMAYLERGELRKAAEKAGAPGVARFMRILEYTPTTSSPVLGPPVLCGVSPPIGIESVLGFLGSQRQTGILRVRTDDAMFMISVVKGDVVHGVSNPRPESELLGNILVERGALDGAALGRFFEKCGSSAFRMGEALGREELVGTDALREALEEQVQRLFDRLLVTGYSEWCFHEGEATLSYINLRMNLTSVLLESARKHDEESRVG